MFFQGPIEWRLDNKVEVPASDVLARAVQGKDDADPRVDDPTMNQ